MKKPSRGRQNTRSPGRAGRQKPQRKPTTKRFDKPPKRKSGAAHAGFKNKPKPSKVAPKSNKTPAPSKPIHIVQVQQVEVKADEDGMRLDRWFGAHFAGLPFSHLQKLIRTGQVRVDKGRVKAHSRLKQGQIVRVPPFKVEPSENREINKDDAAFIRGLILFENDHVMVLNKPAGLAVQGGSKTDRHIDGMLRSVPNSNGERPKLVHRLDRDTSGLLVVARTALAARQLTASFRTRQVTKIYWAVTAGVPHPRQGKINLALKKGGTPDGENMMPCDQHDPDGQRAISYYDVTDHAGGKFGFVALKPVTGRTHQLRVHMAAIGTPILNDVRYFNIENFEPPNGLGQGLHLHARYLKFQDPGAGNWINVTAQLSDAMAHTFGQLGFDAQADDQALIEVDE